MPLAQEVNFVDISRSVRESLRLLVDELSENGEVALARIWLIRAGDLCATCRMAPQCRNQESCLI